MSGYNSNADPATLASAIAQDPKLRGEAYSRLLDAAARQHNAFSGFTSSASKKGKGVGSIFCTKRDLRAGGGDRVNFNVIGTPAGPGVRGANELTGNTSKSSMATWPVRVDWYRDAVEYTKDMYEFLSAGKQLMSKTIELLGHKMGIHEQNTMMMRLIKSVDGNVYRPNNRGSLDDIQATDLLSLDISVSARERLSTMGGMPIRHRFGPNGSPIQGYLIFGTQVAMNPIRNDDGFQLALAQGHARGEKNANFTGELIDWQGMPLYEMLATDESWDGYLGNPLIQKAKVTEAFSTASAAGDVKLVSNASNTKELYYQFFNGYDYTFHDDDAASVDSNKYYAWAVNPDGSVAFLEYTGSGNDGNTITIDKILTGNDVAADGAGSGGTSTKGYKTVGQLTSGTTGTTTANVIPFGTGNNLPTGYVYKDQVQDGAIILQANARGVTTGRSFVFGAMAGAFAYGRYTKELISETRDFGFVEGRGFESVFGTNVCLNPLKKPVNYLLVEHAISHASYDTPSI